ncbi:MAG: hypothetical protein HQL54_12955 [Magnetococcales bacterium]|nr:hypothetical protein [Magnetococcales bacterium]
MKNSPQHVEENRFKAGGKLRLKRPPGGFNGSGQFGASSQLPDPNTVRATAHLTQGENLEDAQLEMAELLESRYDIYKVEFINLGMSVVDTMFDSLKLGVMLDITLDHTELIVNEGSSGPVIKSGSVGAELTVQFKCRRSPKKVKRALAKLVPKTVPGTLVVDHYQRQRVQATVTYHDHIRHIFKVFVQAHYEPLMKAVPPILFSTPTKWIAGSIEK